MSRFLVCLPIIVLLCMTGAKASDDCTPHNVDVCEMARTFQQALSAQLPLSVDQTMSMQEATVDGRRIEILVVWHLNDAELQQRLTDNLMSMEDFQESLTEQTVLSTCSNQQTVNFIQLGGEVRYTYRLTDGTPMFAPLVTECPA